MYKILSWKEPRELSRLKRKRRIVNSNPLSSIDLIIPVFQILSDRVSGLFFVLGLIGILCFPLAIFQKYAFIDENALLPGSAAKLFDGNDESAMLAYRTQLTSLKHATDIEKHAYILKQFGVLDMRVSTQPFQYYAEGKYVNGSNVYAVYTPPRSDGTESIVCTLIGSIDIKTTRMGSLYCLAWQSTSQSTTFGYTCDILVDCQARNFIFIVPDYTPVGTHAWLRAYHGDNEQSNLKFGQLEHRAGIIQEAVNLEFGESSTYTHIDGLNGQQPNADLISTLTKYSDYTGVPLTLHNRNLEYSYSYLRHDYGDSFTQYIVSFINVVEYMAYQGMGLPTHDHALYAQIESMTLFGVNQKGEMQMVHLQTISRTVEALLRSYNNLLEKLHHSFWFYIMACTHKFVMLSVYLLPVVLLFIGLVFQAVKLWYCKSIAVYKQVEGETLKGKKFDYAQRPASITSFSTSYRSFLNPCIILALSHVVGLFLFALRISPFYSMLVFYGSSVLILMHSRHLLTPVATPAGLVKVEEWKVVKCLLCYEVGLVTLITASLNPSQAVGLSIPLIPFLMFARPSPPSISSTLIRRIGYWLIFSLLFFAASPIGWAFVQYRVMRLSSSYVLKRGAVVQDGFIEFLELVFSEMMHGYDMYGSYGYMVMCLVYVPSILCGVWISLMDSESVNK